MSGLWIPRGFQYASGHKRLTRHSSLLNGLTACYDIDSGMNLAGAGGMVPSATLIADRHEVTREGRGLRATGTGAAEVCGWTDTKWAMPPKVTLACRVWLAQSPGSPWPIFIKCGYVGGSAGIGIWNGWNAVDDIAFSVNGIRALSAIGVATVNNIYTLVGTYDLTTIRMYVNGAQVASTAYSTAIAATTDPLSLGGVSGGFGGGTSRAVVFSAMTWDRALAASEVAALHAEPYSVLTR